jgi:hypothetical protein
VPIKPPRDLIESPSVPIEDANDLIESLTMLDQGPTMLDLGLRNALSTRVCPRISWRNPATSRSYTFSL